MMPGNIFSKYLDFVNLHPDSEEKLILFVRKRLLNNDFDFLY
jgi:hypothetical protein